MTKENRNCKKAQQEIFGFVIIIMLVLVMGAIFFGFMLQQNLNKPEFKQYQQVNDLLFSMMHYTTTCKSKDIAGVFQLCVNGEYCNDQVKACDFLNEKVSDILNKTIGNETSIVGRPIYGYSFESDDEKISIQTGNQTGNIVTGSYIVPLSEGAVGLTLYFYY